MPRQQAASGLRQRQSVGGGRVGSASNGPHERDCIGCILMPTWAYTVSMLKRYFA